MIHNPAWRCDSREDKTSWLGSVLDQSVGVGVITTTVPLPICTYDPMLAALITQSSSIKTQSPICTGMNAIPLSVTKIPWGFEQRPEWNHHTYFFTNLWGGRITTFLLTTENLPMLMFAKSPLIIASGITMVWQKRKWDHWEWLGVQLTVVLPCHEVVCFDCHKGPIFCSPCCRWVFRWMPICCNIQPPAPSRPIWARSINSPLWMETQLECDKKRSEVAIRSFTQVFIG